MAVAPQPQHSILEHVIEDAALEMALDTRQKLKETAAEANKAYREADEAVKAQISALDLGDDGAARIGRYVITRRETEARAVTFETQPKVRFTIRTAENG